MEIKMEKALSFLKDLASKKVEELVTEIQGLSSESRAEYVECLDALSMAEALSDEELKGLRIVFLAMSFCKCSEALRPMVAFSKSPVFNRQLSEYDWIIYNYHRMLFSIAEANDYEWLSEHAIDESISMKMREQFVLFVILGWNGGNLGDAEAMAIFDKITKAGIEKSLFDKEMMSAILINVAMMGGKGSKEIEDAVFASGLLGDDAERMKKAVGAVAAQRQYFRNMMLKEQKGAFTDLASELEHINEKIIEEKRELPGKGHTIVRVTPKVGRNDPCPCGSGKKYKKCCGKDA